MKQQPLAFLIPHAYSACIATERAQLATLKRLIGEADLILETAPALPENRTARCREILHSAQALADDLFKQTKMPAAAKLGQRGGSQTAKRGSYYFRQLAGKRKTKAGSRPRKGFPRTQQ